MSSGVGNVPVRSPTKRKKKKGEDENREENKRGEKKKKTKTNSKNCSPIFFLLFDYIPNLFRE